MAGTIYPSAEFLAGGVDIYGNNRQIGSKRRFGSARSATGGAAATVAAHVRRKVLRSMARRALAGLSDLDGGQRPCANPAGRCAIVGFRVRRTAYPEPPVQTVAPGSQRGVGT